MFQVCIWRSCNYIGATVRISWDLMDVPPSWFHGLTFIPFHKNIFSKRSGCDMLLRKALTIVYHSGSNILKIQDLPVTFHLPKQTLQTSVGIRITEGANQGQGSPADGVWEIQGDHNGHKVEASLLGLLNLLSRWSRLLMFLYETIISTLAAVPKSHTTNQPFINMERAKTFQT